jgi:hypothetical protein
MSGFWWGVLVVVALWIFFSMRSSAKTSRSFAVRDAAEPWFQAQGIVGRSITFSIYEDPGLARNPGATVLVGTGQDVRGEPAGFAIEVLPGKGVVEAQLLKPHGIATWHRNASMEARMAGVSLIDVLVAKADSHRSRIAPVNPRTSGSGDCTACGGPVVDGVCWSCGRRS